MLFSKRRILVSVAALSATVVLAGCSPTQDGDPSPPPQPSTFTARFSMTGYPVVPWPNDAFFLGSTDGTINLAGPLAGLGGPPYTNLGAALNTLDGFSTTAPANTQFDNAIDPASLSGASVHMIEMYLSNSNKLPAGAGELPPGVASPISRVLTYGTDFKAEVSPDYDSFGKILRVTPIKPLRPSTGLTNIGYYIVLTNGIRDVRGVGSVPDELYATLKAAPANCSSFATDPIMLGLCAYTKAHLSIAQAVGIDPATVTLSWGFSTQSIEDPFDALAALVPAQAIGVQNTGLTTAAAGGFGKANIYVGTTQVPYYLTAAANNHDSDAVLKSFWRAAGPSPVPGIDPNSRNITRFNPVPGATSTVTIPLLVTVPNATANGGAGCPKPAEGYPVVIFQHGITGYRLQALTVADSFAEACFIVAAIDLPLHGVVDTASPFYMGPLERTFNVDLVNNVTGAPPADGLIDPSGKHFAENLGNPLTVRDNMRQAEADLIVFTDSLANLDIDGGGPDVNSARIHYVGHSMGGIVGGAHVHHTHTRTATLANAGGGFMRLALDSGAFGPLARRLAAASGVTDNSTLFNDFMLRDLQTVIDPADPINHISDAAAMQPVLLLQVQGDDVVPNSATQRLVQAGGMRQLSTAGPHAVGPTEAVWVDFNAGGHSSLSFPTSTIPGRSPNPAVTVEMQREVVGFAATAEAPGGPFVVITDTSVIGQP